jgi:putative lipoprotein
MSRLRFPLSRELVIVAMGLLTVFLVAGCGTGKVDDKLVELEGSVTYREKMSLPPSARNEVELQDKANAGFMPEILGRAVVENAGQVPIGFVITYGSAKFGEGHIYSVHAAIYDGDRALFRTAAPQGIDLENLEGLLEVVLQREE